MAISVLRDKLRSLLKIRVERRTPPFGPRPPLGRSIVRGRHRMVVISPVTEDLWSYLSLLGWREVPVSRDRRRYVDLPSASLDLLMRDPPSEREVRYRQLLENATRAAEARLHGRAHA